MKLLLRSINAQSPPELH